MLILTVVRKFLSLNFRHFFSSIKQIISHHAVFLNLYIPCFLRQAYGADDDKKMNIPGEVTSFFVNAVFVAFILCF